MILAGYARLFFEITLRCYQEKPCYKNVINPNEGTIRSEIMLYKGKYKKASKTRRFPCIL